MSLVNQLRTVIAGVSPDPDPERRAQAEALLVQYLDETERRERPADPLKWTVRNLFGSVPTDHASGRAILAAEPALQLAVIRAAFDCTLLQIARFPVRADFGPSWRLADLLTPLLRRKLPYQPADSLWLCERLARSGAGWQELSAARLNLKALLRSMMRSFDGPPAEDMRRALERLRENIVDGAGYAAGRATLTLLDELLDQPPRGVELIDARDDWGWYALNALAELPGEQHAGWFTLLELAAGAGGSKPSQKWRKRALQAIDALGRAPFAALAAGWLRLLGEPSRNLQYQRDAGGFTLYAPSALVTARNSELLKGLAWCCAVHGDDPELVTALGDAAVACYKKIPNYGARSAKVANACVNALADVPSMAAVAQLQRVAQRAKLPSARQVIDGALEAAAARNGLTLDDLADLATPTFGLRDGVMRIPVGEFVAEVALAGGSEVRLHWLRPDGKPQASVPAEVKRDFPAELKAVKQTVKDLRAALPAQRDRIEGMFLQERSWRFGDWRERYLDHPLLSHFSRRLIWACETGGVSTPVAWSDGRLLDVEDGVLGGVHDETVVRLWHPLNAELAAVLAWRQWLERHGVTQPFKQAHREVYILTDAERATETYSNRFAAHILRQHQLRALCQQRGWRYALQGGWDGHNIPTLELPRAGLSVEYWVEPVDHADAMSDAWIYLYVAGDQVRFVRGGWPVALDSIPPLAFSEAMRDVDLFVAVCSVGADPHWLDSGPTDQHGYWWDFSFGELSGSAQTRRLVLERLLPRLTKLAGRWELTERFLLIRGELRSYKIHLGSGNILMEPNDQYLCIVPGRGAGSDGRNVYLPFEGDITLSVIISKAFMLADDRAITDPTIRRQIAAA